ncbi:hypothetical protein ABT288_49890, partial [Streptomyces sp. NPDC001093]|uniref:hypothetical protein n=1 Tax=Streptomyces sp. NPDC001093 TaxID=3154376 RepID=UPI00331B5D67
RASLLGELRDGRPMTRGNALIAATPPGGTPSQVAAPPRLPGLGLEPARSFAGAQKGVTELRTGDDPAA